jgi:hypothetical protein
MPDARDIDMDCPHCRLPLQTQGAELDAASHTPIPWMFEFEYRSKGNLLGLPWFHVAVGINPLTGLPRLARGVIAIGNFAVGVVAIGGIAAGGFVISGIGFGLGVIAGIAIGWAALGGIALGAAFALGGLALSFGSAIGGLPFILTLALPSLPKPSF